MRSLFACVVFGLACAAIGSAAIAGSDFPQREITFIVPWNAGGSNDVLARGLQPLLREQGFNIVIENITGATGANGLRRVASAAPDGYTLGMGTSSTLAVMVQKKVPLRSDQFTNIARVSTEPLMLLVPTAGPYQTLDEFIEHMKKTPGGVTIGTVRKLAQAGRWKKGETVVAYITGHGFKTIDAIPNLERHKQTIKPSVRAFEEAFGQLD